MTFCGEKLCPTKRNSRFPFSSSSSSSSSSLSFSSCDDGDGGRGRGHDASAADDGGGTSLLLAAGKRAPFPLPPHGGGGRPCIRPPFALSSAFASSDANLLNVQRSSSFTQCR